MSISKSNTVNTHISESRKQQIFDEYENNRTAEILKRFTMILKKINE